MDPRCDAMENELKTKDMAIVFLMRRMDDLMWDMEYGREICTECR
jgi:hypothetical protein